MKKAFLILAFGAATAVACNSNTESNIDEHSVPPAVITAYQQKYPGAETDKWNTETKKGDRIYEVKFRLNDKKKEAEFLPDGTFREED